MEKVVDQHHGILLHEMPLKTETIETAIMIDDNDIDLQGTSYELKDRWTDEETKRLLIFYIDNKDAFIKGITKKKHLWAVACKTMLTSKQPMTCEMKLRNMKHRYIQLRLEQKRNIYHNWPYLDLCYQAFHDDPHVNATLNTTNVLTNHQDQHVVQIQNPEITNDGIVIMKKKMESSRSLSDKKIETMLQLYLNHKNRTKNVPKEIWQKGLWETIAMQLGEEDPEYWNKRFLNFKQHYIRIVDKRAESGADVIHWPYLKYFDEIFKNDEEFQRKYVTTKTAPTPITINKEMKPVVRREPTWNSTEITILVKYYFDCFHEFEDSTIPNIFLWTEVSRLLDRNPDSCRIKYEQLKQAHFDIEVGGSYDLKTRDPLSILFDNIIAKETAAELEKESTTMSVSHAGWKTEEIDVLVQFLYDNIDLLLDKVCYHVCFARLARKLNRSVYTCHKQWDDLKSLYKTILNEKKENPDMEIDWRYIELFDRIFDYGMNQALLDRVPINEDNAKVNGMIFILYFSFFSIF